MDVNKIRHVTNLSTSCRSIETARRLRPKRYVGLKVNTTLKIECSGEENIKP